MGRGGKKPEREVISFNIHDSHMPAVLQKSLGSDEIVPGKIDELAEYVYTFGQCAYLALAIQEETGGGIWAIVEEEPSESEAYDPQGDLVAEHFGVEVGGQILDIDGYQDFDIWENRHGGFAVFIKTEDVRVWQEKHERKEQWSDPKNYDQQMNLARSFVKAVLERK